jgi:HSP20 family protein
MLCAYSSDVLFKVMAIIKWSPFSPFFDQFDDMEKMMNEYLPSLRDAKTSFVPAIDMYEDKDNVVVETQLAGIDAENVEVSVENDMLCIKGEGEKKSEVEDKNYYRKEIRRGSFYRSVQLPAHVNGEDARAEAVDGVLKITIPKAPSSKPKTIRIETKKK